MPADRKTVVCGLWGNNCRKGELNEMTVLHMLSAVVIFFFLALAVGGLFKSYEIHGYWYGFVLLTALAVAFWGYQMVPMKGLDLTRLQQLVDYMRTDCSTLAEALTPQEDDIYGSLIFFRILCYIVSRTDSNQWLSPISVMITFSVVGLVVINYLRSENYTTRMILPSLAVIFMGMLIQYVFSSIRNPMAVTFTIASLYLIFYKKRHYWLGILLYFMAVTTHAMVLIIVPVVLVAHLPKAQTVFRGIALFSMPIIFFVAELLRKVPVALLQSAALRVLYYLERYYIYDRPEMIANITIFLVMGLSYWMMRCFGSLPPQTKGWKRYMNAYYFLGCMMIGCAVRRDFSLRIGYFMGFGAVPIFCRMMRGRVTGRKRSESDRILLALVIMALTVCCVKVFYDTCYVFNIWEFN